MKITLIFAAVLFACAAADECPLMKALGDAMKECNDDLKPTDQTIKNMQNDEGLEDRDTNCLRACTLTKSGLMSDAKLDLDKFEEILKSGKDADVETIDLVMEGMRKCRDEAETTPDECEVAGKYAKCFKAFKDAAKGSE